MRTIIIAMNDLHVAIIENYEECFVSATLKGLQDQVSVWLTQHSLLVPTKEEWVVLILALEDRPVPTENTLLTPISYYKTKSQLEN